MKRRKFLSIIILITIVICVFSYFLIKTHPWYKAYFYLGDKITIKIQLYEDDKPVQLKAETVKCVLDGKKQKIKYQSEKNEIILKTKGNQYGLYQFEATLFYQGKEEKLDLSFLNCNSWNITEIDVKCYRHPDTQKADFYEMNIKEKNEKYEDVFKSEQGALGKDRIDIRYIAE